jgi:hypothetical protein
LHGGQDYFLIAGETTGTRRRGSYCVSISESACQDPLICETAIRLPWRRIVRFGFGLLPRLPRTPGLSGREPEMLLEVATYIGFPNIEGFLRENHSVRNRVGVALH